MLKRLHDNRRFSADPFGALAEFKVVLEKAKKLTVPGLSREDTCSIGAKLSIASAAVRSCRNRHFGRSCDVVRHGILLKIALIRFLLNVLTSITLVRLFRILLAEDLAEREAEVKNLPWTQTEQDRTRQCITCR